MNGWDTIYTNIADANVGKTLTRTQLLSLVVLAGGRMGSQGPTNYRGVRGADGSVSRVCSQSSQYRPLLFVGTGDTYTALPVNERVAKPGAERATTAKAFASASPEQLRAALLAAGISIPAHSPAGVASQIAHVPYAQTAVVIDDAFIAEWHPKYDWTENDESEYQQLVSAVARDMATKGTISKDTFLRIWKWKGAMRVIRHVLIEEYETLYAPAFRYAASEPSDRKLAALLGPGVKLPGVEAATGSTVIHFMHPQSMPIIDVRTVEILFHAGLILTDRKDLMHYEEFRLAIDGIRCRCPSWSLRQIDRALFAYHKQVLDKGRAAGCR
jgi:hypothetical protein